MSLVPGNVYAPDPMYLSTLSTHSLGYMYHGMRLSAPASGTYVSGNRIYFYPFYTSRGYNLARWFWANGSATGTDYVEVGIYDENFNLFKASPRTLAAGSSVLQYANPGVHGVNVIAAADNVDRATYTTASVTLKAGVMYLMAVENSHGTSASAVSAITATGGGAPTFVSRSTVQFNTNLNRVSIWSCVPTADYTGTLDIAFGGTTQTGAIWSLNAFYHVDTATNDGIVQNATGTGSSATPLATLAAFGSANNATFGAFGQATNATGAPESASYIELSDTGTTVPAQALQCDFRPDNDTTVSETITSVAWGACAVEIKSLGTGTVYIPSMRGWFAIHCTGSTATFLRRAGDVNVEPHSYSQSSANSGLPATATPATGAGILYVLGFTTRTSP